MSGDALVVYADGANLNYRVWNGSTWANEQSITEPLAGTPRQLKLASHPYQDEMVLIVVRPTQVEATRGGEAGAAGQKAEARKR